MDQNDSRIWQNMYSVQPAETRGMGIKHEIRRVRGIDV